MHKLGHTRSTNQRDHLLHTPDTFVRTVLPGMERATAVVHISPAAGAALGVEAAELDGAAAVAACAVLAGLAATPEAARTASPALPRLALVGDRRQDRPGDLSLRVLSMQRVHHACPMTVLLCAAAATLLAAMLAAVDQAREDLLDSV